MFQSYEIKYCIRLMLLLNELDVTFLNPTNVRVVGRYNSDLKI